MALNYGPIYTSVSDIVGPSGFYNIKYNNSYITAYIDQEYLGGGWVCVMANRKDTGGMGNLTYSNAVNSCNYRTGGSTNTPGPAVSPFSGLSGLANYNIWIGTSLWSFLGGRANPGKIDVVQFVSNAYGTALGNTGAHTKRYRWRFDGFNNNYGFINATGIADETGTGSPGLLNYHAANVFSLTTYDNDQDANPGGNCSTYYANNPFWYGYCWSGNYFAGGGYVDGPYWDSSGGDYHQYGAVYIK